MGILLKKLKDARQIPIEELYDLDLHDPADRAECDKIRLFKAINSFMLRNRITKAELGRRMNKSRQEITNRFHGASLSLEFLLKAAHALDLDVNITAHQPPKSKMSAVFRDIAQKHLSEAVTEYLESHKHELTARERRELASYRKNLRIALREGFFAAGRG